MKRYFFIIALLPTLLGFGTSALAVQSSSIKAIVGKDVITSGELEKKTRFLLLSRHLPLHDVNVFRQTMGEALNMLIEERLIKQEATRLRIKATDADIEEAKRIIEQRSNLPYKSFDQWAAQQGLDKAILRSQLENRILWTKIMGDQVRPSINLNDAHTKYFIAHQPNVATKVTFKEVFLPYTLTHVNASVLESVRNKKPTCATFEHVVAEASKELSVSSLSFAMSELKTQIRDIVLTLPVNQPSRIIKQEDGYRVIVICEKNIPKLDENSEAGMMLLEKKMSLQSSKYMDNLRRKTYIEIPFENNH